MLWWEESLYKALAATQSGEGMVSDYWELEVWFQVSLSLWSFG
jgi:hypothetical protein